MRNSFLKSVAALMLCAAPAMRAQSAQEWADSAARLKQEMTALNNSRLPTDTTMTVVARSGPFQIAATPRSREEAATSLREFVPIAMRWFGGALPSSAGFKITSGRHVVYRLGVPTTDAGTVQLSALPDTGTAPAAQSSSGNGQLGRALLGQYGTMMFATAPRLSRWLHDLPVIADVDSAGDRAMYMLVASIGENPRACVRGDDTRCLIALEIRAPPPNGGSEFVQYLRGDLLYTALRLGGDGAWTRLHASDSLGVEAELAAAAGMPIDSLITRWRQGLLSRRASDPPVTAPLAVVAVLWTTFLLASALGASRWA